MAKAKFQDTLKNGLTGVATVGKKIVDTAGDGAAAAISKARNSLTRLTKRKTKHFPRSRWLTFWMSAMTKHYRAFRR